MPNRLTLSEGARHFYQTLDAHRLPSFDEALDYIRDAPFSHGGLIRRESRPPVMMYFYDNGVWRIGYVLSFYADSAIFHIHVLAISRA